MPPSSTVPPSGTLTVVTTETNENDGNCTVTPLEFFASLLSFFSFLPSSSSSVVLAGARARGRAFERERVDVADLREERHDGHAHVAPVVGDDGLDRHHRAFVEHDDHRLLCGREFADDRDHADDERPLRGVGDERLLAVEQRDFRRVEHVRAAIALSGFDQEVGFDIAENREAEVQTAAGEAAERRQLRLRRSCSDGTECPGRT